MAGTINQAKMKFSRIVNSRSYTRFSQSQNPDGDSSRVVVKLSVEGEEEEEMDGTEQGHVQRDEYMRSSVSPPLNKWRIMVCVGLILTVLCVESELPELHHVNSSNSSEGHESILIGYSVNRKSESPSCSLENSEVQSPQKVQENQDVNYDPPAPSMDWSDIVQLLNSKLSFENISKTLSENYQNDSRAGSSSDSMLGDKIHNLFTQLKMHTWVDEHFVKLQYPNSSNPNKVWFGQEEIGSPKGFLAYSETGRKEGRVVYANYGELSDLQNVQNKFKVNLNGSVVLMRAGVISMAQKVMNAAKMGAVAALIFPDQLEDDTELYGHVHLGSGDPYTPGFPSFDHTQFPPVKSSGLPGILAQTITNKMAKKILAKMVVSISTKNSESDSHYKLGQEKDNVTVAVYNNLVDTKIHNVFGVIKGYIDPDRYVVIGAQRDSLSWGYAKSTVGTTLLMELARVFTELKKDGFKPKRSIVFASWSAGYFGNVGVTEWLEGYWASLDRKAFAYISLDGVVTGEGSFRASASPLLHTLLQKTLQKVKNVGSSSSLLESYGGRLSPLLTSMQMDDAAYPVLAFSGIPSVSFSFYSGTADYKYFGTDSDDKTQLDIVTGHKVVNLSLVAAQVAGQMALRLVHDHILKFDVTAYGNVIANHVSAIISRVNSLNAAQVNKTESLSTDWLIAAKSSFGRATDSLAIDMKESDLNDIEMCRMINNRIMRVEHNFLSPYISLREIPFRHVFFGNGWQTATDLEKYLDDVHANKTSFDIDQVLNKFALLTWTIQGCANDIAGDIWSLDNEI